MNNKKKVRYPTEDNSRTVGNLLPGLFFVKWSVLVNETYLINGGQDENSPFFLDSDTFWT